MIAVWVILVAVWSQVVLVAHIAASVMELALVEPEVNCEPPVLPAARVVRDQGGWL